MYVCCSGTRPWLAVKGRALKRRPAVGLCWRLRGAGNADPRWVGMRSSDSATRGREFRFRAGCRYIGCTFALEPEPPEAARRSAIETNHHHIDQRSPDCLWADIDALSRALFRLGFLGSPGHVPVMLWIPGRTRILDRGSPGHSLGASSCCAVNQARLRASCLAAPPAERSQVAHNAV